MNRRLAALLLALLPPLGTGLPEAAAAEAVDTRWRLPASHLLPFATSVVEQAEGSRRDERGKGPDRGESLVAAPDATHGVFGFEAPGGRDHRTTVLRLAQLPFHLACRLPPSVARAGETKARHVYDRVAEHAPVRADGAWRVARDEGAGAVEVVGEFSLSPASPTARHPWHVARGRVVSRVLWDVAAGTPRSIRYGWSWERRRATPVANEPASVEEKKEYALEAMPVRSPDDAGFEAAVDGAIGRGVEAVRRAQRVSGGWDAWYEYECGPAALSLLTLLESEVDASDPAVERGFEWLLGRQPKKTYEIALSMMAVDARRTPPTERRLRRRREPVPAPVRRLTGDERAFVERGVGALAGFAARNGAPAGVGYATDRPDLSNTQYAALGLRAAEACGVPVPERLWASLLDYALRCQETEGPTVLLDLERDSERPGGTRAAARVPARGAGYENPGRPTASMTAALIATARIAEEGLARARSPVRRRRAAEVDSAVRSAFAWIGEHYSVRQPWDTEEDRVSYTLYGVERACVLEGVRRLGGRDWYREGALWLLHAQRPDGSFPGHLHDTCFALLFLRRATAPRVLTGGG